VIRFQIKIIAARSACQFSRSYTSLTISGTYTVESVALVVVQDAISGRNDDLKMYHQWTVRESRPITDELSSESVLDTVFPAVQVAVRDASIYIGFPALQKQTKTILQVETKLRGIVRLVGKESLSEDQKLNLGMAELIREDLLQQDAFATVD